MTTVRNTRREGTSSGAAARLAREARSFFFPFDSDRFASRQEQLDWEAANERAELLCCNVDAWLKTWGPRYYAVVGARRIEGGHGVFVAVEAAPDRLAECERFVRSSAQLMAESEEVGIPLVFEAFTDVVLQ